MEKCAKVFLLSNKKEHYDMLIRHGYTDILWFKTTNEVLPYLMNDPRALKGVDLVFVRDIFYDGKNGRKVFDKVYKEAYINAIPYVEISHPSYMFLTKRVARNNLTEKDMFNILNNFNFSSNVQTEAILSKDNGLLNVLFIGEKNVFPFVESYFTRQGFASIKCVSGVDLHDEDTLKELMGYDIIISGMDDSLVDSVGAFSNCLSDKNHLLYLASFNVNYLNEINMAHLSFADTNSCEENRKTIYTYRDCNKLQQYILDSIMEDYSQLNERVTLNNIKTFNEVLDEYIEYRSSIQAETERIREKLFVIDEIDHLSRIFMRSHVRRDKVREIDGIRFERLENAISVAFIHEGMILARITYKSDGKNLESPYYKEFNLEVQNSKGYLMNLGMRSIYDDRRQIIQGAPPVIREDDYVKVDGIYKKLLSLLKKKNKEKVLKLK